MFNRSRHDHIVSFHGMMVPSDQSRKSPEISFAKKEKTTLTSQEGLVRTC